VAARHRLLIESSVREAPLCGRLRVLYTPSGADLSPLVKSSGHLDFYSESKCSEPMQVMTASSSSTDELSVPRAHLCIRPAALLPRVADPLLNLGTVYLTRTPRRDARAMR